MHKLIRKIKGYAKEINDTERKKLGELSNGKFLVASTVLKIIKDNQPEPPTLRPMSEQGLTEATLSQLGFKSKDDKMFINGKRWLLMVTDDYVDVDEGKIISKDGTWFEGIGDFSFEKTGKMAVNILCKGNYVCNSLGTVEEVKRLYLAMTGVELTQTK